MLRLLLILQAGWPYIRAGYTLAAFSGSLRQDSSDRRALLTDLGSALLLAASLAETALAFGISLIAWSLRAGCSYDLIDDRGAIHIVSNRLNDFGNECWQLQQVD